MNLLYEKLKKIDGVNVELDDLIFICMKIAFLEGIKFERTMEDFLEMEF